MEVAEGVRCAVVGHVEWVDFVPVERVPEAGEILTTNDHWAEPAGGGVVAVAELIRLGAETTNGELVMPPFFGPSDVSGPPGASEQPSVLPTARRPAAVARVSDARLT